MRTKKDKRLYHSVAEKLEKLIESPAVRQACEMYRDALAGEDAIGRACELLEALGDAS